MLNVLSVVIVRITATLGSRSPTYTLTVGSTTLEVEAHVQQSFASGERYALYYLPHSRALVSAEPLSS